jgi:hypothetical protein
LSQRATQIPGGDHGKDTSPNKAFPRLVGRKANEGSLNEFAATSNARKVGHDIIDDDQQEWKGKPKESVENVVHDVFHLSERPTQYHNGPTQLIELEFDMSRLHRRNRQDKSRGIQKKGQDVEILRPTPQIMQMRIVLNDFTHKVAVGIKDGDEKPRPLGRSKERNGILNGSIIGIVADFDQFAKE